MEIVRLTVDEAIDLLKEGDSIHTIRNSPFTLIGFDRNRNGIIDLMKLHESTLQLTGRVSRSMGHGMCLEDEKGYLFIETDKEKLDRFNPLPTSETKP